MAEQERSLALRLPWATLLKILVIVAIIWLAPELVWLAMLILIAIIIAVGLAPAVAWLQHRHVPRWLAVSALVAILLAAMGNFVALTSSELAHQSADVGRRIAALQQQLLMRAPQFIADAVRSGDSNSSSTLARYAIR